MFDDEVDEDNSQRYKEPETVINDEKHLNSALNRETGYTDDDDNVDKILTDHTKSTPGQCKVLGEGVVEDKENQNLKPLSTTIIERSNSQDLKKFTSLLPSKKSFSKEYKKIYFEKEKAKNFYLRVLIEVEKTIRLGDVEEFKNVCKIIDYLYDIENITWLKDFYDHKNNPLKGTNLIILACKYNNVNILQYLFRGENEIIYNLSTAIKRNELKPGDQDNIGRTAFYYAIRDSNVDLLNVLINEWPSHYFNSSTHLQELDDLVSSAYGELKLKNVLLSKEIQNFVENKLINLRFFFNNNNHQTQKVQTDLSAVMKRIDLVVKSYHLLKSEYSSDEEVDEKFIFIAGFATQNIHVLKKQLKSTYDKLPWEEIEFCFVCFISAHIYHNEINLIYRTVLTKASILSHLEQFITKLEQEKDIIKEADINSGLPKLKRENAIKNIVSKHQPFSTLYSDFEKIRNVYSMQKIVNYIEFALLSSPQEIKGQLIIERALLVTGECLKNTLESPNLSDDLSEILLSSGLQNDTLLILRSIRNLLSHSYSISKRIETEKNDVFSIIQSDLKKIKVEITEILFENKLMAVREVLNKILDSESIEEIIKLVNICKYSKFDKIDLNNCKSNEHEMIEKLVQKLKKKITNKTYQQEKLFQEIDIIINSRKNNLDSSNHQLCLGFVWLNMFNFPVFNEISGIKFSAKSILDVINPKIENGSLEKIAYLSSRLYSNLKATHRKENVQKLLNKVSYDFKNIGQLSVKFLRDSTLSEHNDFGEIVHIILKIAHSAHFKIDQVKGLEAFKIIYNENKNKKIYFNNKNDFESSLFKRLQTLNDILSFVELRSQKLLDQFHIYEKDNSLQVATEMLVFDIIEILKNHLANNQLLFDTHCPLLIGKSLRNHLAHGNALVDILPYNPLRAIFANAIKFIEEGHSITKNNIFIGQPISDDLPDLEKRFNYNLNLIINQKEMLNALKKGNFEKVKEYINKGGEIKSRDINKRTSLHFAAGGGNLEIVKFLLENGMDINSKDINGETPLHMAVSNGRMNIVKYLIGEVGLSTENIDNDGRTFLHIAANNGYKNIVEYLLNNNAKTLVKDTLGFAPVHLAIINNNRDIVKTLLSNKPNVDFNEVNGGFTPLHIAAEHGHLEIVDYLIKSNANVNAKNDNNWIPLHAAALKGHPKVVKALVLKGADVNTKAVNGCTPLHYAVENGREDVVGILVEHGANINDVDNTFNSSALHYVSKVGNQGIVEILLKNNANVNIETIEGMTPLHFAAQNGHLEIVKGLIKRKANINANKYAKGVTPLDFAIQGNHKEIVECLLAKGANVNPRDYNNLTPLHMAALNGNKIVVDMLIKKGANIDAISSDGNSPLFLAITRCHINTVKTLIENGADYQRTGSDNLLPIHLAASRGYTKIVEMLIKKNIYVDSVAYIGGTSVTPLHCAVVNGNLDTVKILIDNGSNCNAIGFGKFTPLHLAIENGNTEVFKYLIQNKINVDLKSYASYMHSAVWQCNREIVEILIENGGKPTVKDLHTAIQANNNDVVKIFIKQKIDVNEKYENMSLLTRAALIGNKEIVKILLDSGADINIENSINPLHIAAYNDRVEIVNFLLKKGAKVNAQSDEGITSLHIAAEDGYSNVVEVLLKNGAKIDIKDNKNRTPLELAVANNQFSVIKILMQHIKGNINDNGNDNWSLLHIAAQAGNGNIVKYLINEGADIDAKNSSGSKPIQIAAKEGHWNIVDLFLSEGLTVNEVDAANQSILHYATSKGHLEVVKYLTEKAIDVNAKDANGMTPLHTAAAFGYKDVVQVLLDNSAIYNALDNFHCTPTQLAKNRNVINILESTKKLFETVKLNKYLEIELHIRAGACVNAKNTGLATSLHYAAWKGYNESVDSLLQNKANPNITGKNGYSSLHYAVKFSHLEVVKSLLSNGAIYNAMDNNGKIPLHFAENKAIINLLKLIDASYENVQNSNFRVIDILQTMKDVDIVKAVMNTQNRERKTLIVTAIHNNFPKVEMLKQLLQENVSLHIHTANLLLSQEKFQEALVIFEKIFQRRKEIFGLDSPSTLDIQNHIATVLYKQRKYQEALKILYEVYQKQTDILGINYNDTLDTRSAIGLVLHRLGRDEEALIIYQEVCKKQKEILGINNTHSFSTQLHMALVLDSLGRFDEALNINQEIFKSSIQISGTHSLTALAAQNNIAMVLTNQKKYKEALKTYEEVYKRKKHILGPHHSDTLRTLHNIGTVLMDSKNHDKALQAFNDVLNIQKSVLGLGHLDTLNTQNNIAHVLFSQGKIIGAHKVYIQCFDQRKAILGDDHPDILDTIMKMKVIKDVMKFKGQKACNMLEENSSIHVAVNDRNIEIVKELLLSGIDVNIKDNEGRTPLHYAVNKGDISIVKLLLDNGADATQATNKGNTPLHTAASKGCEKIVESLLHHVKKLNPHKSEFFLDAKTNVGLTTALHVGAQNDNKELVVILLQYGACYDVKNAQYKTPLDLAKSGSDTEIFLSYINRLFKTVQHNQKDQIEYLLKEKYFQLSHLRKAILYARESNGRRTLIQVASREDLKLLLEKLRIN